MIRRDYKAELKTAHEEISKMEREIMKRKATCEDLRIENDMLRKDRDYWQETAMRGGGNG